jgi:O-methyltransferase domain/Dimerisation domain
MSDHSVPSLPLPFQLSRMVASLWVPRVVYAAAALGIADVLADGAKRSPDVAGAVGAHPGALRRLLRAMVVLELCTEADDDTFALTPLGACLRAGTRDSVRSWALLMGSPMCWESWGRIVDCVRTGEPVPQLAAGMETFQFLETHHPEAFAVFDDAMVEMTRHLAGAIAVSYDFSDIATVVDVGGGYGSLLVGILKAYPTLRGTVADLPHCREGALRLFEKAQVADRAEFVAQSMFEAVPAGADAYVFKSVIHDWNDDQSVAILRTCRAAMRREARLLLIEVVVSERLTGSPLEAMCVGTDLNMLVNSGGRERTEAEFRMIIERAGLRVTRVITTLAALSVIEAVSA